MLKTTVKVIGVIIACIAIIAIGIFIFTPMLIKHGSSIISFSEWLEHWRPITIVSRLAIYGGLYYCWPSITHHLVSRKVVFLVNDDEMDESRMLSIKKQLTESMMEWRVRFIYVACIYEAIMLYSSWIAR